MRKPISDLCVFVAGLCLLFGLPHSAGFALCMAIAWEVIGP